MKYHKIFLLGIEILNYLKYVCFGIGKRYFFEFNLIDNDGDVHLLVSMTQYIFLQEWGRVQKVSQQEKSLKNTLRLKNSCIW